MPTASTYDALIVGAGPAGSAAAWALARAGLRVAVAEEKTFPRDKVCGDALIPDALGALDVMGLRAAVQAGARPLRELRIFAPSGRSIGLAGDFACVPRLLLDEQLVDAARRAGAVLLEGLAATAPRLNGDVIAGATFASSSGPVTIDAPVTLLATGANATALAAFGLAPRLKPNAIAGRAYFRVPDEVAARCPYLSIVFDRPLCPGYGWIFPGPDNRFNVGVGTFGGHRRKMRSLHDLWRRFTTVFEPAATIVRRSEQLTEFRGAPLRTGLAGARFGRPGLLALGEAAAMTYPATGEGIGKAMESGLLAARLVQDVAGGSRSADGLHDVYESEFRQRFGPRYSGYGVAEAWSARPWLLNLLIRRAASGSFVRGQLESLVAEQGHPRDLFSAKGLVTAVFR